MARVARTVDIVVYEIIAPCGIIWQLAPSRSVVYAQDAVSWWSLCFGGQLRQGWAARTGPVEYLTGMISPIVTVALGIAMACWEVESRIDCR